MTGIKLIFVFFIFLVLGGCKNIIGFDDVTIHFIVKNETNLNLENLQIELDDGIQYGSNKSSNVFHTIKYNQIEAGASANLTYQFQSTKNGEGLYRIIVKLSNGKQLSYEFGYFDSSLNVSKDYYLSVKEDKILLVK